MAVYVFALLIGVVAGLRAMTAPAAVSWAAHLGKLSLQQTPFAFLGAALTPYLFTLFALGELVADQLPNTPSRKVAVQFGTRLATGGFCGAALGASTATGSRALLGGFVAGLAGAALGTLGGAALRTTLARAFGKDLPAALIEDALAVGGAILVLVAFG